MMALLCALIAHAHLRLDRDLNISDESELADEHTNTHARTSHVIQREDTCSVAGFGGEPMPLTVPGSCDAFLWGMEHYPIIKHAAKNAIAHGGQCVYVEAGAHKGTLAVLAAKQGCTVYAFEMSAENVADMTHVMKMNSVSKDQVHVFQKAIGDKPGSRVDEVVPRGKVTVLKMDIDGLDALAMRGAKGLFSDGGVDVINIEFSPPKQEKDSKVSSVDYLTSLVDMGYSAYLSDCYGRTSNALKELGLTCMSDERGGNHRERDWRETKMENDFFVCLLEGCTDRSAVDKNRIDRSQFKSFIDAASKMEVDMVLVKDV